MAEIEKRKSKKGEISYRVKVRLKGCPAQYATFKRLTDAKRWEQQTESAIREGRYFKASEAKRHTLAEAIDRYVENILPRKPKIALKQYPQYQWWKEQLGNFLLVDITPALLAEHRDKLAATKTPKGGLKTPATINRYLAALSHLFTIAIKEWEWMENNPLRKISKLKEPRGRDRYLSDDERDRLLKACKESDTPYLYLAVILAISTGARKMEIFGLRWERIDFDRNVIVLNETKNGDCRSLTLAGYALNLMQTYSRLCNFPKTGWLFPSERVDKPIDLRKSWDKALKQAGVSDFKFHDLRHTAASYLAMNNATVPQIAEVLGHKTLQMVKRYVHLSKTHVSSVVAIAYCR